MKLNKMVFDDKKIEEAARGAADLYEQDLPMMSYNEDTEVDGQHHFCQEFGAELFKDGAKWAINEFLKDLWHPASEEPKEKVPLLYYRKHKFLPFMVDKHSDVYDWNALVCNFDITKWLYIDDLFQKVGGNQ